MHRRLKSATNLQGSSKKTSKKCLINHLRGSLATESSKMYPINEDDFVAGNYLTTSVDERSTKMTFGAQMQNKALSNSKSPYAQSGA